nr:hypothetical protein H9T68_20980 [Delftia sp. PS-11]
MLATGAVMFAVLLALGSHAVGHDWPVFIATGLLAVLAFGYSCKIDVDLQRLAGQPMPAAKPPRERTHRQDLELAMAHNMGGLVANPAYPGDIVGKNIKLALDAMLPADSAATLAADRWRMSTCQKGPSPAPAKGLTAPRVTLADVEAEIVREHYFTAEQGAKHPDADAKPYDFGDAWKSSNLGALTFCVLVLKNGTKVVGINYGAIDLAQHDAARGCQEARTQAVEKVWELLGFRLRDRLAVSA